VIFSILITASPAIAAEEMMDNLLPSDTSKKQEGKVHLDYNEYPLSRYGMDTQLEQEEASDFMPWGWDEGVGKQIDHGMSLMNSTLWGINKIVAAAVGTLVSESFNFEIISDFSDDIAKAIKGIAGFGPGGYKSNGLWPYLVTFIVCMIGIWAAYVGIVKRATSRALGGILTSIITMALALGFFTNADKILNMVNDTATEIQNDLLSFSLSATNPGKYSEKEGIALMRNQIFNLMVKYPYLLLEYGTTDERKIESEWNKSGDRVDAILKTGTLTKERQEAIKYEVEELNNENMKPESLTNRFIILVLSLIMNAIMGTILLLLSSSLIFYQILTLVFAIFTPVAFLIGLIPAFAATARNIAMKLLHAFYMKIALSILMTVYFTISSMVYNTINPKEGYILLFMIQIIVTVAVWVKRHEIMNVVTVPFRNFNVNNTAGQNIKEFKQTYFKGKKYFNKVSKPFTTPAKPLEQRTSYKLQAKPGVGVVNPITHPAYAPKERKSNQVQNSAPAKQIVKQESVSAPIERSSQPVHSAPVVKNHVEPKLNERANFESLTSTLEKGGHAHRVNENKEPVQLKTRRTIKDQLVDRKAGINNKTPNNLHTRNTGGIKATYCKDDKNES
jgi:hypothetical protein